MSNIQTLIEKYKKRLENINNLQNFGNPIKYSVYLKGCQEVLIEIIKDLEKINR